MEHIASSKRGGAVVTSEVDKFHLRYLFGARRCTRARSVRNYSGRWDGRGKGMRTEVGGRVVRRAREAGRNRNKKVRRQKRGRVRPSISAPLITFSHLSI